MALRLLVTPADGPAREVPLLPGRTTVTAYPAEQYRLIGAAGEIPPNVRVLRMGNALVVDGLPDAQELELGNFFGACRPGRDCALTFEAPGAPDAAISNESVPAAALNDGSFLLLGNAEGATPVAVSTADSGGGPSLMAGLAGLGALGIALAAAGGGGGGGGGSSTPGPTAVLSAGATDAGAATPPASGGTVPVPVPAPAPVPVPGPDVVAPVLTIVDDAPGSTNRPVTFTFRFSEPVVGFDASDVAVTGGTKGAFVAGADGTSWTLTVTPDADVQGGRIGVDVAAGAAQDAAGNRSVAAQATQLFDTHPPRVSIADDTSAAVTNASVRFTFAFDEPVSGFTVGDILVGGGTAGALVAAADARSYQLTVTPTPGVPAGQISVDLPAGAATDAQGNLSTAAVGVVQPYDTLPPVERLQGFVAVDNLAPVTGNMTTGQRTNDTTPTFSLTLDTVLAPGEVQRMFRDGGLVGAIDAGRQMTFTDGPLTTGEHGYTASIVDLAGNVTSLDLNGTLPGLGFAIVVT